MEYGNQFSVTKSFYDWCVENNRMDLNDRFDEEKNNCTTKDVGYKSNLQWWFKRPIGAHDSEQYYMTNITNNAQKDIKCRRCNSVAQVVIDRFGNDYFLNHWHSSNEVDPWDIQYGSGRTNVVVQCDNKSYHVYQQAASSFAKGVGCPYCICRKVHPNDSLAAVYPVVVSRWSDKNEKSPYEYAPHSDKQIWLKCPTCEHDDYLQTISNAVVYDFRCPECSLKATSDRMKESGSPFWKGGINGNNDTLRHRREYKQWRDLVYKRDDYTCQCCGNRGGKLNAHHINQFADYPDLRYEVDNGITLCTNCHDATIDGSFHNIYGTHNTTSWQLREYIFNKYNKDIFQIIPNLMHNFNNTKLMLDK